MTVPRRFVCAQFRQKLPLLCFRGLYLAAIRSAPSRRDHFAVQHLVFHDMADEGGIFRRFAKTRWERHGSTQRVLHFLRHSCHHRGLENAGRNGHHTNAVAGKFARDG